LHNCRVRPVSEGQYALTFGARRCLAVLYLHAKHGRPAKVGATVGEADGRAALVESAAENIHLPPSYIDQARLFKRLRDQGLTVKEIAKVCPMGKATEQNIRHRLILLELTPDEQLKVHHGKLSQDAALKLLATRKKNNETPHEPPVAEPQGGEPTTEGDSQRRPDTNDDEVQAEGESVREELPENDDAQVGDEASLRLVLQDFFDRLDGFDLDRLLLQHPDLLLRLVRQVQKRLTALKRKASKGKAPRGRLVLVG
jgi:hypothetical protein